MSNLHNSNVSWILVKLAATEFTVKNVGSERAEESPVQNFFNDDSGFYAFNASIDDSN